MKTRTGAALARSIAAAALLGAGGCDGNAVPRYTTAPLDNGTVVETVTATGTLNAVTTVQVGSQVSGTIKEILVDFNSPVRKGQVIARIDPQLFEAQVVQARGALANAEAALNKAVVQEADADRTLKRNKELIKDGFVAQADVDAAQTAYDAAVAQRRSAEAQVDQAKGALSVAATNLRYTTILSPVDGIVVSRNVDVGQTVAASFQTPTLFTIAQDLTKMQIDTNVDESDIGKARTAQAVTFTVDAYPEKTFSGAVSQVRNAPIVTQNVVTYDVVVRVDNRDLLLKPGMTANVSIRIRDVADALRIPNAALRYRPADSAKTGTARGDRVYLLGKDGKPEAVPVKLGISDGSFTEAVSGNVRRGDRVILSETAKRAPSGGGPAFGMGGFR